MTTKVERSGKQLQALFGHERELCSPTPLVLLNSRRSKNRSEEDKWRFHRMDSQIPVKRFHRETHTSLKSATELANKQSLSSNNNTRRDPDLLNHETRPTSGSHFQKQPTLLRKSRHQECVIDVPATRTKTQLTQDETGKILDVEILTRKMEGLSQGRLLKKMEEEYGSILCRAANASAATSQRYDLLDLSSSLQLHPQEKNQSEKKLCAGNCKVIVRRIMEQVRAETEQWSQMQEMVGQVREEMERLQASRDFWEARALDSDKKLQSLNAMVKEWKQKELSLEIKEKQLQLGDVVKSLKKRSEQVEKEGDVLVQPQVKEKTVLTCRVKGKIREGESFRKEKHILHEGKKVIHKDCKIVASPNRMPFHDMGNFTPLTATHNTKRWVLPLQTS